jgi:RHS repeat-associated protein
MKTPPGERCEWNPVDFHPYSITRMGFACLCQYKNIYTNHSGMLYLRARWYQPHTGRFFSPDTIIPDFQNPQSINRYLYVVGNPIRYVDPAGLCAIVGATDCEKLVSEIRCMIEGLREARECNAWLELYNEEALILDLLAWHYSGIPFTWQGWYLGWVPRHTVFIPGVDRDRWEVPRWDQQEDPRFTWDHPVNRPDSDLGQAMRQNYGFKRPYFENTHHYFAFLKFAYHIGGVPVEWVHRRDEIEDNLQDAINHIPELEQRGEPRSRIKEWYAWRYRESVYDLYIVREAVQLAWTIAICGVDVIPGHIESKWCADSEADVWSLESQVDQFYFEFPREYWPDEEYWPGR